MLNIGVSSEGCMKVSDALKKLLADTYALYLKTQYFHWNVVGENFSMLHAFFEGQYSELAEAVDEIAERIRTLGAVAPGSFSEFSSTTKLKEANSGLSSKDMLRNLLSDHQTVITTIQTVFAVAQDANDEATIDFLNARLAAHQKNIWMLSSHLQ